ncbi:hypothetical protein PENSPDRAFT_678720 [Peniophora sp. CONT]|nr:hypothetical protein PENSPDRAFT_678720 [Peniophora sp. CONT]
MRLPPYFIRNLIPRRGQLLKSLTWIQWALFWSGRLAWFTNSLDFFSVSLSVTNLQRQFNNSNASDITTTITLTLLFRAVGVIGRWLCHDAQYLFQLCGTANKQFLALFGIISDRFACKWLLVFNLILVAILELGTGFSLPVEVRGLASRVLQQGYGSGYPVAAVANLFLLPNVSTSAGMSLFAAGVRALLPELDVFLRAKAAQRASGATSASKTRIFIHETCVMLKSHWVLSIYAFLLLTDFTFFSHESLDLYPTCLQQSKYISQYIDWRLTIILLVLWTGAFIPLWIIPGSSSALAAGAWGVILIQLDEISPPAFRATFPGVAYQVGNVRKSHHTGVECLLTAKCGENLRIAVTINGVTKLPDYARVQGILFGVVAAFVLIVTILGPEAHGSYFEKHKTAFEEGGGGDDALREDEFEKDTVGSLRAAETFDEKEKGSISFREAA